jgi:ABC-type uncharacterized transport system involved in gliding motility auxiliary subunit
MWKTRAITLALLALTTVLAIHVVYRLLEGSRVDLTAENLYSLTPGTEQIIERMHAEGVQPVDVKLYFSETAGKTLPKFIKDFITYERYLRSLLGEYARASRGKIRVELIDPIPDSDEAQDAVDYGLDGKPINQHGDLFFFGLVLQAQTGSRQVIDFLWPEQQESVEYEISKRLHNLLWPPSKRIGVLSSLEVFGSADNPYLQQMMAQLGRQASEKWLAVTVLEDGYKVSPITTDTDHIAPDEYDLVVVIHPKNLPQKALWALDEWVTTGGRALIFLDPYTLADVPPQNPQQPWARLQYKPASNLDALLEAWGVQRPEDQFAADFDLAVKRPVAMRGPEETVIVDLLIDGDKREQTLAQGHPVMQGLASVRLFLPGFFEPAAAANGDSKVTRQALLTTTPAGNALTILPGFGDTSQLHYPDLNEPAKLRDRFAAGSEAKVLAYELRGQLGPAFPNGADFPAETPTPPPGLPPGIDLPPPEGTEMIHKDPVPEADRKESTVLLFADVDLIWDQIAFQRNILGIVNTPNDNYKILLNAVDYLLGANELMNVRARRRIDRPFDRFDEIEAAAERDTLEREKQIRAEIETFQTQLQEKQSEITQRNAALFQKQLQEEVDQLNEKINAANRELREIRKARRASLEREEAMVRLSVLGWMPALLLGVGLYLSVARRRKEAAGARTGDKV